MTMQDEHTDDSPVPLTIDQNLPSIGQIPQTPAPSEQFVFPETFLISQDNADISTQPAHNIVSDTSDYYFSAGQYFISLFEPAVSC